MLSVTILTYRLIYRAACLNPSQLAKDEMYFRSMEDRLNPVPPADADEATLGGYFAIHGRSPGFTGSDGMPYTVATEVERSDEGETWSGYLIFLRWAENSTAIMGHLDSADVVQAQTEDDARRQLGALSLPDVKRLLDDAIDRRARMDELFES